MTGRLPIALVFAIVNGCRPTAAGPDPGSSSKAPARSAEPTSAPARSAQATGARPEPTELRGPDWTAGVVEGKSARAASALLTDLRAARHEGFDRLVFQFAGDLPSYHVEYVDRPVRDCGAGEVVQLAGDAWLSIGFEPADAHTPAGVPTIKQADKRLDLELVHDLKLTCDFEAHVTWVVGLGRPNRFRVFKLQQPTRLVVDVRHF